LTAPGTIRARPQAGPVSTTSVSWRGVAARQFGGLPRTFWVVFAGQLVNRVGSMVIPFLVYYLTGKGLSPGEAGGVLAAAGLGGLISQPLGGLLADRIGIRFTLVGGLLSSAVSIALVGLATGWLAIVAAAVVYGVVADVYRPAAAALVATIVASEHRPRAFSLVYWAVNLGVGIAGLLGGILVRHGYLGLFVLESSTSAVFAVLVVIRVPRIAASGRSARSGGRGADAAHGLPGSPGLPQTRDPHRTRGLASDRLFQAIVALNLAAGLVMAEIPFGIPLAVRAHHLSESLYGTVFLVCGLMIGFTQPPLAAWLRRFDRLVVLSVSWMVLGAGMALNGLADRPWHFILITLVWTGGEIGAASMTGSLVADLASPGAQGRYQAAFGWSYSAAQFAGPLLGVLLYDHFGLPALWWSCVVLGPVSGAIGLTLVPSTRHRVNLPGCGAAGSRNREDMTCPHPCPPMTAAPGCSSCTGGCAYCAAWTSASLTWCATSRSAAPCTSGSGRRRLASAPPPRCAPATSPPRRTARTRSMSVSACSSGR
jgi:MFS family permease